MRDDQPGKNGDPVWWIASAQDLRSPALATANDVIGILFDSELGLVLYIIPYAKDADLRAQVTTASNLQSSLYPLYPPIQPLDEDGPWQVAIYWLVEQSLREDWENQIVQLRQETGLSEKAAALRIRRG